MIMNNGKGSSWDTYTYDLVLTDEQYQEFDSNGSLTVSDINLDGIFIIRLWYADTPLSILSLTILMSSDFVMFGSNSLHFDGDTGIANFYISIYAQYNGSEHTLGLAISAKVSA